MRNLSQQQIDRAKLLTSIHGIVAAAEIMGVGYATLYRAKRRGWVAADSRSKRRHGPSDFVFLAKRLPNKELMGHYRTNSRAVARWLQERPVRGKWRARA